MTDNEIIKALNYCCGNIGYNDEECNKDMCYQVALPESRDGDIRWCKQWLIKDALDLINRQKAEIERLKDELHRAKVEISKHFDYMDEATNESLDVFADSLKIKLNRTIDNLLKEMAGDTK